MKCNKKRGTAKRFIITLTPLPFRNPFLQCSSQHFRQSRGRGRVKEIKGRINRRFGAMGCGVNFDCDDQTRGWMVLEETLLSTCWRQASCQRTDIIEARWANVCMFLCWGAVLCRCVYECVHVCVLLPCVYPVLWATTLALFSYPRHAPPPTQLC